MPTTTDKQVERLEKLLDLALLELISGNVDNVTLALDEAVKTAETLPKKASA